MSVAARPRRTVTFLFTDVEQSTWLLKQLGDRYPAALAEHQRLVREAFSVHGGDEVDTQGDSFFYVFSCARDAAAAAVAAQRALAAHPWPDDKSFRIRIGMHTGEAAVSTEGRHHGLGVVLAARIAAVAHGGQVLVSQATAAVLSGDEADGVALRDLGAHRLKDIDEPERIYQIDIEGLPGAFPPLDDAASAGTTAPSIEYRVLGPLEVVRQGRSVPLGGIKQRALLALLLLDANRVVARERLVDLIWGEEPPETAVASVQVYVSRLRKQLPATTLLTRGRGYVLELDPESVDLLRFERLLADARNADPEQASYLLRAALELWRGPALAEFVSEPFAQVEIGRLEDLHRTGLEMRIAADLALGRHSDVVGELDVLVAAHPHRERLIEQLMLALYRSGRQTEALAAYRRAHASLAEFGLEPGPNLQRLERQILNHDQEIDAPPQSKATPSAGSAPDAPSIRPPALERRHVTALFIALATTNEPEEDPESTAAFFDRLHAEVAAEIASAGGILEQGLVGAQLATFGATSARQPDHAIRAANAALATHKRLTSAFGGTLSLRMGLESGEVILGRPGAFAVGTPVATAARLASMAEPGEIAVGEHAAASLGTHFGLYERGTSGVLLRPIAPLVSEVRKTVTVLFADLVDSSRLGEQLDPEAKRGLLNRCFVALKAVVGRHGGTVDEVFGDAVSAVFGVPSLHEDDALRAVRAAAEMREAFAKLNDDVERQWGVRLEGRIGITTGEVIVGGRRRGEPAVTGEVLNVARRLNAAAAADEILIGEATYRLVRDAVVAERAESEHTAVAALRLLEVRASAPGRARRFDSPLVNREKEMNALRSAFDNVVRNRACHLQTVLGAPGVGKSRLVHEFLDELGSDATIVQGHCLEYGDGITYWPLNEVMRELVRTDDSPDAELSAATIAALLPNEADAGAISEQIAAALGLGEAGGEIGEETFWAVRKLFEALAHGRPLVVVFDDVQWAEPTFIQLVDHLAALSRDAPILLVCMARPEVLDAHPGWGGGMRNAASMLLEPLDDTDCRRLITNLLGRGSLPASAETRIAAAADGNPLFAEELLAMLIDDELLSWGDGIWRVAEELPDLPVPRTINSLLSARLESLPEEERDLLVRASVEGATFHMGAVRELASEHSATSIDGVLAKLVQRDVIRPDRSSFAGDEAYRFRHILICDAAYSSLAKTTRADLHERLALWLEQTAGSRTLEFEEIIGYHLEQAYRNCAEIGSAPEKLRRLGKRAADLLSAAGARALGRNDVGAALKLLRRALALHPPDDPSIGVRMDLCEALLFSGALADAEQIAAEAADRAAASGDQPGELRARLMRMRISSQTPRSHDFEGAPSDELLALAQQSVPLFERVGDDAALTEAWLAVAWAELIRCRFDAMLEAVDRALAHAQRTGHARWERELPGWKGTALFYGATPVVEVLRWHEQRHSRHPLALRDEAVLQAMSGRFDEARSLAAASDASAEELGQTLLVAVSGMAGWEIEMLAGDAAEAEAHARRTCDVLEQLGDRGMRSLTSGQLAQSLYELGRLDEAGEWAETAERLSTRDDVVSQMLWRQVRAKVLARTGQHAEAARYVHEAVALADETDMLDWHGRALVDLAEVLALGGQSDRAAAALEDAASLFARKGNTVAESRTRRTLLSLQGAAPATPSPDVELQARQR